MSKIYDAVHGFIHFNDLEQELIDSSVFQRLHYIHQLGIAYLIYPGGTHTRFEHSLGTMELATRLFDQLCLKFPHQVENPAYWRQILRFAALCHDLGHLPFSHTAEKRLLGKGGHEKWTARIIASDELKPLWEKVYREKEDFVDLGSARQSQIDTNEEHHSQIGKGDEEGRFGKVVASPNSQKLTERGIDGNDVESDVIKMALGKEKLAELFPKRPLTPWEEVLSEIIAGDFFGADRIDYLLRDAKSTGLSYGLFDYSQLIEMLTLIPNDRGGYDLGVEENGLESCEALLLARHFMQRRLYQYPSSKAYAFHLSRFMAIHYSDPKYTSDLDGFLSMSEPEVLVQLRRALSDKTHKGHLDALCLMRRDARFQAIALPLDIEEAPLLEFKEKFSIPETQIEWDLSARPRGHYGISLPILRRSGIVVPSHELSEISIPPTKKNWLYLAPDYQFSGK